MSNANATPEAIEQLLDRVSSASERLAKVAEEQSRQLDRHIKELVDRAEADGEALQQTTTSER